MDGKNVILPTIIPGDAVNLGWFVLNIKDPLQDFFVGPAEPLKGIPSRISNLSDKHETNSSTGWSTFFAKVLRAGCRLTEGVAVDLKAAEYYQDALPNAEECFQKICASKKTREWVEKKLESIGPHRLHMYMIVKIQTAKHAKLVLHQTDAKKGGAEVVIPTTKFLGDPGILAQIMDLKVAFDHASEAKNQQSFECSELIYAIQYRPVKLHWWRSADLDAAYLSRETVWRILATDAGGEEEDENAEDVLEAVLSHDDNAEEEDAVAAAFLTEDGAQFV